MKNFHVIVPPIKCQGIKTKLVPRIRLAVPANIRGRWIEPFMGSGAVAFNMKKRRALLADSNPHLINFYRAVAKGKITSATVRSHLEKEGALLLHTEGEHYYAVRKRFNLHADPLDFLFLNRAGFNGMIRFNRDGGLNVPFCRKPTRFAKALITKICNQVHAVSISCALGGYEFKCQDYLRTIQEAKNSDFLYCDPPYAGRHADYYNGWDDSHERALVAALSASRARFMLSSWHSNRHRTNQSIATNWAEFNVFTCRHFYHVGARENNRNAVLEALVTNYSRTLQQERVMAGIE